MYKISKAFDFCYGHRVWNQSLECGFAESLTCKCRHLHGHEAVVVISLSAMVLRKDMVTDFNNLGWFKAFLNRYLDHKFIIDRVDPLCPSLLPQGRALVPVMLDGAVIGHTLEAIAGRPTHEDELANSFFVVDFVPTSENFSKWVYGIVSRKMNGLGVRTDSIEWRETPKSISVFVGDES